MITFGLLGLYIAFGGLVIFVLLFGGLPTCEGTPVGRLHWLVTDGLVDAAWRIFHEAFGPRASQACEALWARHCSSTSPVLQILYILLLAGGYFLYCGELFCFLPQPSIPSWHQYSGAAVLGMVLSSFAVACVSGPGIITLENYAQHAVLYAHDGVIYDEKQHCWVCQWKRPARSKHCSVTDRCVARYDHYCPWIRNTIGMLNLRWFMLFLLLNILLCSYGAVLGVRIMEQVVGQRAPHVMFRDPASGRLLAITSQPSVLLRWTVQKYPLQVALISFLTVALLLVTAFFCYHLWLILCGTTSYESYKWRLLYKRLKAEQEAEGSTAPCAEAAEESSLRLRVGWLLGGSKLQGVPANAYDWKMRRNLEDALIPPAWAGGLLGSRHKQL